MFVLAFIPIGQNAITEQPIAGATSASFTAPENGNYKAQVTDANGCDGFTDCVNVTGIGIASAHQGGFIVFPNPASNEVIIRLATQVNPFNTATLQLTDLTGKVLLSKSIDQHQTTLSLIDIPAGAYLVQFKEVNRVHAVEKLIVIR